MESIDQRGLRLRGCRGARRTLAALDAALSVWVATVRGTYPTPEAGTRSQYVLYVGP